MNQRLDALVRRAVFASPPGPTAAKVDKLRFMGRLWARIAVILLIGFVLGAVEGAPTVMWIVWGVSTGASLVGCVKLWFDLRRERQHSVG